MVGFGRYDYTCATGHSGSSMATGFAPRKAELSLYVLSVPAMMPASSPGWASTAPGNPVSASAIRVRHLDAINADALRELIAAGLADLRRHWPVFGD